MIRKYFLLDKNYILKDVQAKAEKQLLNFLVTQVLEKYQLQCNPLGLIDDTIAQIKEYKSPNIEGLHDFYELLAGVFRYQIGTNQLEFMFDGKTHAEKYHDDWVSTFKTWVFEFCQSERFLKAVLALTVFCTVETTQQLAENRLRYFVNQYFNVKIYRYKGIIPMDTRVA